MSSPSSGEVWAWDFAFDRTSNGSLLKWLAIVDEHTHECLALKVVTSITGEDLIDTLAELFAMRGVPSHIRSDNGPEFLADAVQSWLHQLDVQTLYLEPGSRWEHGYAESFFSKLRDEFLHLHTSRHGVAVSKGVLRYSAVSRTNFPEKTRFVGVVHPKRFCRKHLGQEKRAEIDLSKRLRPLV